MHAPAKAAAHTAPSAHLTLRVQCEAPDCGALLEVAVPRSHTYHGAIIVRCGNCNRLLEVRLGREHGAAAAASVQHGDSVHQQAGGSWAHDQHHAERSERQQEARGVPPAGLMPDPKEDANRVIEDILARSHVGSGDPAWAARGGGAVSRSRYTPQQRAAAERPAPRTYVAPHISNQHYSMGHLSTHSQQAGSMYLDTGQQPAQLFGMSPGRHSASPSGLRLKTPRDLLSHAQQTSMRTEELLRQRMGQTPSLYQQTPSPLQRHPLEGYGAELGYSTSGSGLHGYHFQSSAGPSQGYRTEAGPGQDMYGLSTDPYDLHSDLYNRAAHNSTPRLGNYGGIPESLMYGQDIPADITPNSGRKRPASQLPRDRHCSEALMGDPRDVLRGDRWKLQRVRSLSALPTDADLLASLKDKQDSEAKAANAHKIAEASPAEDQALQQHNAEQQQQQREAAEQPRRHPDEIIIRQPTRLSSELSLSPNGGIAAAVPRSGPGGHPGQHPSSASISSDVQPTFMILNGPQSTEAAAELALPATSATPNANNLDTGSPRSQGSFNIFNLSPQDFSLSPMHRGHNDSQQGSPTGGHLGALSPFAMPELRFTPTPPPIPEGDEHTLADREG